MSEYIRKINTADQLANYWQEGALTFLEVEEALVELGFSEIEFKVNKIWAKLLSKQVPLGGCYG